VSGIRTEQCCETTTRHASDVGFEVDYVLDATLTFAMIHADGTVFSASEIRQRTATVLEDRFATVVSVEDALERAQ
jgi:nicotinamidase-related amidase